MTQDPDQNQIPKQSETPCGTISDGELIIFLKRLAALYRSPTTGNPPLSAALFELASLVSNRAAPSKTTSKLREQKPPRELPLDLSKMRELDIKAVQEFIADESKTKLELIELASARFSIPRSQLKRSRIADVRETIKSACLHEDSIKIISQDARRDGLKRSS